MPTNSKVLQRLFALESKINDAGEPVALAMSDLFIKLDDGQFATDQDWSAILLHVAHARHVLDQIERGVLKAREEPVLYWRYNE